MEEDKFFYILQDFAVKPSILFHFATRDKMCRELRLLWRATYYYHKGIPTWSPPTDNITFHCIIRKLALSVKRA